MKFLLFFYIGFANINLAYGQDAGLSNDCLAKPIREYLAAIQNLAFKDMAPLLHPKARYRDPTMVFFNTEAIDLAGPSAIIDFWQTSARDTQLSQNDYQIVSCLTTPPYTVLHMNMTLEVSGKAWQSDKERIQVKGTLSSIYKLENGLITEHTDYVDYQSLMEEVARQR